MDHIALEQFQFVGVLRPVLVKGAVPEKKERLILIKIKNSLINIYILMAFKSKLISFLG